MSNKFSLIIRSNDRNDKTNSNSNDCSINMNSTSQYRFLQVKVKQFYISKKVNEELFVSLTDLRCDGIHFLNGSDIMNSGMRTIAITDIYSNVFRSEIGFLCENFSGSTINFKIYDENNNLLLSTIGTTEADYNSPWILVLECEEFNDLP